MTPTPSTCTPGDVPYASPTPKPELTCHTYRSPTPFCVDCPVPETGVAGGVLVLYVLLGLLIMWLGNQWRKRHRA